MGIYRRVMGVTGGTSTWLPRGSVTYPTATFTDSIVDGTIYEYKIDRPTLVTPALNEAATFLSVTLDAPIVHNRGTLLLYVDNTFTTSLAGELAQLEMDLAGDGWTVQRSDVARAGVGVSGTAPILKAAIQAAYNADPTNVKAVYLFGRLPYAMSGCSEPDGHAYRPEATDGFYGDMTGTWTDNDKWYSWSVVIGGVSYWESQKASPTEVTPLSYPVVNSAGDGIYDPIYYPAPVTLMVGRVDLSNMAAFSKVELELMRDYIHKQHAFRTGQRTEVSRNGLWNSGGNELNCLIPLVGASNMAYAPFKPTLSTTPYLFAMDFGNYNGASTDYTATPNKLIFGLNFGSGKQDFNTDGNAMRALLAQPDWGLTCVWGERPAWFFHHMAAGLPVGYTNLRTMNNNYVLAGYNYANFDYFPNGAYPFLAGSITVNMVGDPTLRLDPVVPPGNVTVTSAGALTWTASTDGSVTGYHVYRASNQFGPYDCLTTGTLVTGTSYQDNSIPVGVDVYYQVRSVKTEAHTSTNYTNNSIGAFAKLNASGIPNHTPTASGTSITVSANQLTEIVLTGSDSDGNTLTPIVLTNPTNGQLRWNGSQILYMPADGYTGSDSIRFVMSDGVTTSAPATINITVNTSNLLEWRLGSPATGVAQNLTSTLNATGIAPSTITNGPAISQNTFGPYQDDSVNVSTPSVGALNLNNYIQWIVAPASYYKFSLDRVSLGIWNSNGANPITTELHWSDDGFVTSHTITMGTSNQMTFAGLGTSNNQGRPFSGDLSSFTALQGRTTPVTFRLYFWAVANYASAGLGKLGTTGTAAMTWPSLVISGSAATTLTQTPSITSALSVSGTDGIPFSYTATANNGATNFMASGLPPGLTLNGTTGVISGTITASGTSSVLLSASNILGTGSAATVIFSITDLALPSVTSPGVALGGAGNTFSYTIGSTNYPTSYSAVGLPPGLSLNPTTGVISGTLSAVGTYGVTIGATNFSGSTTTNLTITVGVPYFWSNFSGTPTVTGSANGLNALFNAPNGVAVDSGSNIYVADTTNHSIRKITPAGSVSLLAGTPGSHGTTNGQGSSALFYTPYGLAVDSGSNVYVADTVNNTIRMITPSGLVSTLAGTAGTHGTTNGQGTSALFYYPYGVAVDSGSNVYVADTYNNTIRKISVSGSVSTLAGTPGTSGTVDGSGTTAQFYRPEGVAVDNASNVYIADTFNNTIREITAGGMVITLAGTPGASGTGSADGIGSVARFNRPMSIAVDSGTNLYIGDRSNQTIRKMVLVNGIWNVTTIGGTAALTGTVGGMGSDARFNGPAGVAVSSNGNLLVADASNDRISVGTLSIPGITSGLSMTGTNGVALSYTITASNAPVNYYATGLPSWLSLNTSTGVISGTPTTSGTFVTSIGAGNQFGFGTATWILTVLPSGSAYQTWQSLVFTAPQLSHPTISGDTANPTGDGISNLMKYALGMNPNVSYSSTSPQMPYRGVMTVGSNQYLTLTFTGSATDVTYSVQGISDLIGAWTTLYSSQSGTAPGTVTVSDTVPMSSTTKRFMRLQVSH